KENEHRHQKVASKNRQGNPTGQTGLVGGFCPQEVRIFEVFQNDWMAGRPRLAWQPLIIIEPHLLADHPESLQWAIETISKLKVSAVFCRNPYFSYLNKGLHRLLPYPVRHP